MIVCGSYNEARLDVINLMSDCSNYISHLHITRVDGLYYIDYEEDYMYAHEENEEE